MKVNQIKQPKQLTLNQCKPYKIYNDHLNWFLLQVIKSKNKRIEEFDAIIKQGCKSIDTTKIRI